MTARFRMTDGYHTGEVVRLNPKTIWVRVVLRGQVRLLQRHRCKHDVTFGEVRHG